jgi:hypothetical protein
MKIQVVPVEYIQQGWHLVEGYLAQANLHGGDDYTTEQIRLLVGSGQWLLIVAVDSEQNICGAATVAFNNMPNDRVAFVTFIGGKLIASKDTFAQLVNIVKAHGATKLQGAARESVARLWGRYGFEKRHIIVEKRI